MTYNCKCHLTRECWGKISGGYLTAEICINYRYDFLDCQEDLLSVTAYAVAEEILLQDFQKAIEKQGLYEVLYLPVGSLTQK